jgi:hypothetical protein
MVGQEDRLIAPFGERERKRLAQLLQTLLFNFELGDTRWPLRRRVVGGQPDGGEG